MKSRFRVVLFIITFNLTCSVLLLLNNFEKIDIEKFWLNFLFYLLFLWNVLLVNLILKFKNEKSNVE